MAESFHLHHWRQPGLLHAVHRLCPAYAARWLARRRHDPLAELDDEQSRQLSELGRERRIEARFGGSDESRW
jgi:hypothetical protein